MRYRYRSACEFAKEAMKGQKLDAEENINLKWAYEDPNPVAAEAAARADADAMVQLLKAKGVTFGKEGSGDVALEARARWSRAARVGHVVSTRARAGSWLWCRAAACDGGVVCGVARRRCRAARTDRRHIAAEGPLRLLASRMEGTGAYPDHSRCDPNSHEFCATGAISLCRRAAALRSTTREAYPSNYAMPAAKPARDANSDIIEVAPQGWRDGVRYEGAAPSPRTE